MFSDVICPTCESPVTWPAQQYQSILGCPACRHPFRAVIEEDFEEPRPAISPRLRRGLSVTVAGGFCLLVTMWVQVGLIALVAILGPNAPIDTSGISPVNYLFGFGTCGLALVSLLAITILFIGCLLCLATPAGNGWLGWSLACFLLALVALGTGLVMREYQSALQEITGFSDANQLSISTYLIMLGILLLPAAVLGHGLFLARLAAHLRDGEAALNCVGYLATLFLAGPALLLAFVFLFIVEGGDPRLLLLFMMALILVASLFLCWWLSLLQLLRMRAATES